MVQTDELLIRVHRAGLRGRTRKYDMRHVLDLAKLVKTIETHQNKPLARIKVKLRPPVD